MRILLLFPFFLFCAPFYGSSMSTVPATECDTLITESGKVMLVRIEKRTEKMLHFRLCDDPADRKNRLMALSYVKEIRKAIPAPPSDLPAGAVAVPAPNLPEGAVEVKTTTSNDQQVEVIKFGKDGSTKVSAPEDLIQERKTINRNAKLAGLFSFGSLFLLLFSIAFSPFVLLLLLPALIAGLIFAIMTVRKTKRRPEYAKQYKLGKRSLTMTIIMFCLPVVYIFLALIFLLFLLFSIY